MLFVIVLFLHNIIR